MRTILTTTAAAALLLGCAPVEEGPGSEGTPGDAKPIGEPVDCIQTSQIDRTHVVDDRTIDFHMKGRTVYRNTLPHACPNLAFDRAFSYRPTAARLCSVDTITVLSRGGGIPGPTCGLGQFQPIEDPDH